MLNPIKFIKNIPHYIGIISYLLYIGYLGLNIIKGKGVYMLNLVLLAVSAVFLVIYGIMFLAGQSKKKIKSAKRYFKWFKLGMRGLSLFIIVYGFVTAASSDSSSMLMPSILISLWLVQISAEISKYRARKRREKIKEKISGFKEKFRKPKAENTEPMYDMDIELRLASSDDIKLSDDL